VYQDLQGVIGQMKELSISIIQQPSLGNPQNIEVEKSPNTTKNKDGDFERGNKKDQDFLIDNRIHNLKVDIKKIDRKIAELKAEEQS